MSQQSISLGSSANDGTGDTLRDAGQKINENFTELYGDYISISTLQSIAAASADFAAFKTAIAAL